MGLFASLRMRSTRAPEAELEIVPATCGGLRERFVVVGEALASGADSTDACGVVGRDLARRGASLVESLTALREVYQETLGADPSYDDVLALSQGWSESTLGYLHQLSCEDPMTGLSSLAHLRGRLSELYRAQREGREIRETYALVVVDLVGGEHRDDANELFDRARRLTQVGEAARTVFAGAQTITRLEANRIGVLTQRDDKLAQRAGLLRRMVGSLNLGGRNARVWIEGLPGTDASAAVLLDELARV